MSQKAASMPAEPEEEQVLGLMEFTGLMREQAIRYLKAKSNDVNAAATAFFDGEDISKVESATQWDEGAWGAGKEGEHGTAGLHPLGSSAAATRPNSPAPSTSGRSYLHPTSKQQEDDDFAQAMAMSQGNIAATHVQETGYIGANGQHFGPATKDHYDASQWAMIPTGQHQTTEIVLDVDAEHRRHVEGEPRLLKYLPTGDYMPNLLTICQAIVGARETLLMRDFVQPNYGQDEEWWRGHAIAMPKIVHVDDGSAAEPESDRYDELLAEVQRLMAFLSASHRTYASVGALIQTDAIKLESAGATRSHTLLELFLEQWSLAASSKSPPAGSLFSTTVGTNAPEGVSTPQMTLVDMQVNVFSDSTSDLFEQLDDLLWDARDSDTAMTDNYIERPAEVLVMRAYQQNAALNPQLRLEIPAQFYVDKYLPENIEATRTTRIQMANARQRISKIEEIERKLTTWKHPTKNEQVESMTLIRHTFGHFSGQNKLDVLNPDRPPGPITNAAEPDAEHPHYQDIAQKLEKVISSIDEKLFALAEEKEKTKRAIAEMSKAPPAGLTPQDLKHRYILRGVATKPNITYVLAPADPNAASDENDMLLNDDSTPPEMQWWRMEYEVSGASSGTANITKTKSADYDVLRAVELEHSSALLVYASDAMNGDPSIPSTPLPPPLQAFIDSDNALFAAELHSERRHLQPTTHQHYNPPAYDFPLDENDNPANPSANNDARYGPFSTIDRSSMDSTRGVGGGSSAHPSPPHYPDDDEFSLDPQGAYAQGIKQGYSLDELEGLREREREREGAEVHEIRLGTPEPEEEDEGIDVGEMQEEEERHGAVEGMEHVEFREGEK
ncbi:hypothetical protein BDY17DRAFT_248719 [Neohortaea acidophila]|uniref:UBA domain-containing protein n=1 Tax=Neohortaea acidophila TaxID=245834 RepID=A0A6A6PXY2_9PEZI|nr:uncharacterized protein BDY17DRAFT_248719 [Neohortaea acidophila]KAF2484621.1 hypothetical protein BDY17DRAFT_248719 [Neohortaea acidophila]